MLRKLLPCHARIPTATIRPFPPLAFKEPYNQLPILPPKARLITMTTASGTPLQTSKTTQRAIAALRKLYPEELADKSFDNTGLLLESPSSVDRRKVLLTIDLTAAVAAEAVEREVDLVVAYRKLFNCFEHGAMGWCHQIVREILRWGEIEEQSMYSYVLIRYASLTLLPSNIVSDHKAFFCT